LRIYNGESGQSSGFGDKCQLILFPVQNSLGNLQSLITFLDYQLNVLRLLSRRPDVSINPNIIENLRMPGGPRLLCSYLLKRDETEARKYMEMLWKVLFNCSTDRDSTTSISLRLEGCHVKFILEKDCEKFATEVLQSVNRLYRRSDSNTVGFFWAARSSLNGLLEANSCAALSLESFSIVYLRLAHLASKVSS